MDGRREQLLNEKTQIESLQEALRKTPVPIDPQAKAERASLLQKYRSRLNSINCQLDPEKIAHRRCRKAKNDKKHYLKKKDSQLSTMDEENSLVPGGRSGAVQHHNGQVALGGDLSERGLEALGRGLSHGGGTLNVVLPGNMVITNYGDMTGNEFTGNKHSAAQNTPASVHLSDDAMEALIQKMVGRFATEFCRAHGEAGRDEVDEQETRHRFEERIRGIAGKGGPDDIHNQRHKEVLMRLADLLSAVNQQPEAFAQQFQEADGPIQETVRTAVKDCFTKRRNPDNAGGNLVDRFESAYDTPPCSNKSISRDPSQLSPDTKSRMFQQLLTATKPKDIVKVLELSNPSYLGNGVLDHLESVLILIQEIQSGECDIPNILSGATLEEFVRSDTTEKLCDVLGDSMFLYEQCFVSVSANDTAPVHEHGDQVRTEVLGTQRSSCVVGQSIELFYHDETEAVIEFNSVLLSDAKAALNLVFLRVVEDAGLSKCLINAPADKVCVIRPDCLETVSMKSPGLILHLNGCKLDHHQMFALRASLSPLIFDNSPINMLESFLFSSDVPSKLKVAFTGLCPPFDTLAEYIGVGKLSALMIEKIDLQQMGIYNDYTSAVGALNALVELGNKPSVYCDLCLGDDLTWGSESISHLIHNKSAFIEYESIDVIAQLGTDTKPPASNNIEAEESKEVEESDESEPVQVAFAPQVGDKVKVNKPGDSRHGHVGMYGSKNGWVEFKDGAKKQYKVEFLLPT